MNKHKSLNSLKHNGLAINTSDRLKSSNSYKRNMNINSTYDLRSDANTFKSVDENTDNSVFSDPRFITFHENSNKNLNLDINKLRNELNFFKKACKMYEKQLNLTNLEYSDENVKILSELEQ